jgi:hypothetical protein
MTRLWHFSKILDFSLFLRQSILLSSDFLICVCPCILFVTVNLLRVCKCSKLVFCRLMLYEHIKKYYYSFFLYQNLSHACITNIHQKKSEVQKHILFASYIFLIRHVWVTNNRQSIFWIWNRLLDVWKIRMSTMQ